MAFLLRSHGKQWVGDISWRIYAPVPSGRGLRAEAHRLGAIWIGRCDGFRNGVGYLTLTKQEARGELHSLAVAMAAELGKNMYVEFDIGGGQLWLVATDTEGRLLPGSDKVYTTESIESARENLSGFPFSDKLSIAETDLESYVSRLKPARLRLSPVSRTVFYGRVAIGLGLVAVSYGGLTIYQAHEAEQKRLAAIRELAKNAPVAVAPSGPAEWVDACLGAVPASYFHNGWVLSSWSCEGRLLSATWENSGGVLLDAPAGVLANSGRTVIQSIGFTPAPGFHEKPVPGDPIRQLLSAVRRLGAQAAVSTGRYTPPAGTTHHTHEMLSVVSVQFDLPVSPHAALAWDQYARLEIRKLSRTLLSKDMTPKIGGYSVSVAFVAPNAGGKK